MTPIVEGREKVVEMINADPVGEVYLMRDGKKCIGYMKDGVIYYAAMKEVNLDNEPDGLIDLKNLGDCTPGSSAALVRDSDNHQPLSLWGMIKRRLRRATHESRKCPL